MFSSLLILMGCTSRFVISLGLRHAILVVTTAPILFDARYYTSVFCHDSRDSFQFCYNHRAASEAQNDCRIATLVTALRLPWDYHRSDYVWISLLVAFYRVASVDCDRSRPYNVDPVASNPVKREPRCCVSGRVSSRP